MRVLRAEQNAIRVPRSGPDERYVYLSDVLPTAWQAVRYADIPEGGSVTGLGLGPIGQMACRVAKHLGAGQVFGIEPVPDRRVRAAAWGVEVFDSSEGTDDLVQEIRERTDGRGPDAVIDAVGMEAS